MLVNENNLKNSCLKNTNSNNNNLKKQDKSNIDYINNQDEYILELSCDFSNISNNNNNINYLEYQAKSFMLDRENAKISAKNQKESFDIINQCAEIANRIMNGDKVPFKDEQFLLKYNSAMYSRAIAFIRENDAPKKYEEISQDPQFEEYLNLKDIDTSSIKINLSSVPIDVDSSSSNINIDI